MTNYKRIIRCAACRRRIVANHKLRQYCDRCSPRSGQGRIEFKKIEDAQKKAQEIAKIKGYKPHVMKLQRGDKIVYSVREKY